MSMVWLELKTYVMELATSWGRGQYSELNLGHLGMIVMMMMMMINRWEYESDDDHHHH